MRRLLLMMLIFCMVLPCAASAQVFEGEELPYPDWLERPLFRITFFQAGQSDAMLLECGGEAMMVDGGANPFRDPLRAALEERGITSFKYLLNTHYHDDHVNGLYWLMNFGFQAGEYLHPYTEREYERNKLHRRAINQARDSGIPTRTVGDGDILTLGDATLKLYRCMEFKQENGQSLVTRVTFGDASALLCADIIGVAQKYFAETLPPEELKADLMKIPHHGITPVTSEYMDAVSPSISVVTGFRKEVRRTELQSVNRGIAFYCSADGTVVAETDGKDWRVWQLPKRKKNQN